MIKFLASKAENISKQICSHSGLSFGVVQKKLRSKEVLVNGTRVSGGNVEVGDEIIVFAEAKKFEPKIIFEDGKVLVVDKPRGIESEDYAKQLGTHAVHRLDRNTAGVLMTAKTRRIKEQLMDEMAVRPATKFYLAKVFGQPKFDGQVFVAWHQKRAEESFVKIYKQEAKGSVKIETQLQTVRIGSVMSIVEAQLTSGKTHQIRAHLAFLGFPIVGDEKYGNSERNKVFKEKYQQLFAVKVQTNFVGEFEYLNDIKLEAKYAINV